MPLLRVHALDKWALQGLFWKYEAELGKYDQKPLANEVCWNEKLRFLMMIQWNPHVLVQGNLSSANDTCTGVYGDTTGH